MSPPIRGGAALLAMVGLVGLPPGGARQSSGDDYPQWRGIHRDGSASAFLVPAQWPDTLTMQWKAEIGAGYATPILVGDTLYTFTRQHGHEVATALDVATGDVVWETGYLAPYEMFSATRAHGEGPKATPLFHRDRLYTHGISGAVSAFDATTGDLLWQLPPPDDQPFFGAAVSPLADGDLVILHPGYGPLTAFDARTGDIVWTSGGYGVYASPVIAELGGVHQVVSVAGEHVEGVAVAAGELLWEYPIDPQMVHAVSPLVYNDTVLVTGQNSGVKALRPVKQNGMWKVEVVWETTEVSMTLSNPVLIADTLFGLSDRSSGQLFALDARSGDVLWLGQAREAENTAVVKAGDILFLLNDDAELIVARASREAFDPVTRYTVADSPTWAQPVISGRRVFVKDRSSVALWTLD